MISRPFWLHRLDFGRFLTEGTFREWVVLAMRFVRTHYPSRSPGKTQSWSTALLFI